MKRLACWTSMQLPCSTRGYRERERIGQVTKLHAYSWGGPVQPTHLSRLSAPQPCETFRRRPASIPTSHSWCGRANCITKRKGLRNCPHGLDYWLPGSCSWLFHAGNACSLQLVPHAKASHLIHPDAYYITSFITVGGRPRQPAYS